MATTGEHDRLNRYARIAGMAYLIIIVTSMASVVSIEGRLVVPGDPAATFGNIDANLSLYRAALAYETVMFAAVILLSVALFTVLRTVDPALALLAMLWRVVEAMFGVVSVLIGMLLVLVVENPGRFAGFSIEQLHGLADIALGARTLGVGFNLLSFFLAAGTIVFCYLFWKSRLIPRILSGFGIAAFTLMLIAALLNILTPAFEPFTMIANAPGILFEFVIGLWLTFRGIDPEKAPRAA